MNTFKVTLKGHLDFVIPKTYDMATAHFQKRLETYYKMDIALKGDEFFQPDTLNLVVPRMEHMCGIEKTWKNTIGLLNEIRTYSVAGALHLWVQNEKNQLIAAESFLPVGDKVATTEYLKGISLSDKGKQNAAIEAFTKAIDKHNRYAQAYERRGVAYFRLGRLEDALLDFSKSNALMPNAEAYVGLAETKREMGDLVGGVEDLATALKNCVPFQPVFWTVRRLKGEMHLALGQGKEAAFEFKFFSKRLFNEGDPNLPYKAKSWSMYVAALEKAGEKKEAIEAAKQAKALGFPVEKIEIVKGYVELQHAAGAPKVRMVAEPA
jgi:tetratricopeptide (TPR) repeat protein